LNSRRRVNSAVRAHRCVRTASGSDPIKAQLVWMIPSLPLRVLTHQRRAAIRFAKTAWYFFSCLESEAALPHFLNDKPVARYNLGRSNKSLDASGGGVFRNLIHPAMRS
jgi:hypothetical protein